MSNDLLTNNAGAPVVDNENALTAGPRGPMLLQDTWFLEKLAHFVDARDNPASSGMITSTKTELQIPQ